MSRSLGLGHLRPKYESVNNVICLKSGINIDFKQQTYNLQRLLSSYSQDSKYRWHILYWWYNTAELSVNATDIQVEENDETVANDNLVEIKYNVLSKIMFSQVQNDTNMNMF